MTARPTIPEPIVVAKFWRTRHRNEIVQIELSTYEGHNLISVRVFRTGADGIDRPTTKGLALSVGKLKELSRALIKAEAMALELNLIDDESEGEQ
jgi:hypothetical protein